MLLCIIVVCEDRIALLLFSHFLLHLCNRHFTEHRNGSETAIFKLCILVVNLTINMGVFGGEYEHILWEHEINNSLITIRLEHLSMIPHSKIWTTECENTFIKTEILFLYNHLKGLILFALILQLIFPDRLDDISLNGFIDFNIHLDCCKFIVGPRSNMASCDKSCYMQCDFLFLSLSRANSSCCRRCFVNHHSVCAHLSIFGLALIPISLFSPIKYRAISNLDRTINLLKLI